MSQINRINIIGISNRDNIIHDSHTNMVQSPRTKRKSFDDADRMNVGTFEEKLRLQRQRNYRLNSFNGNTDDVNTNANTDSSTVNRLIERVKQLSSKVRELEDELYLIHESNIELIFNSLYPLGSIYTNIDNTLPFAIGKWKPLSTSSPFTWTRVE